MCYFDSLQIIHLILILFIQLNKKIFYVKRQNLFFLIQER